ncbi:hypothetical protein QBC45DRAFT_91105 [Copromyces sp. CBS 386.78]|nr:hypothetical protein QBC45DRAFT_91105 [Copromyces sp. CBS 386.78]
MVGWLGVCAVDQSTNVDDNQDAVVLRFWAIVKEEAARDRRSIISQHPERGVCLGFQPVSVHPALQLAREPFFAVSGQEGVEGLSGSHSAAIHSPLPKSGQRIHKALLTVLKPRRPGEEFHSVVRLDLPILFEFSICSACILFAANRRFHPNLTLESLGRQQLPCKACTIGTLPFNPVNNCRLPAEPLRYPSYCQKPTSVDALNRSVLEHCPCGDDTLHSAGGGAPLRG